MASKEYEFFLKADLHKYEGKYIAIVDESIVASGDNAKQVIEEAERKTGKKPTLAKVPTEDTFIFMAIKCKK
ncbi:succinyl-CoA synthetase subunit alpha [Candidatus Micrarchaeota archaeon]|nr:succinyl-CoA synthetase subunit alpha [Candidatus Micrarchaeota archaeon]